MVRWMGLALVASLCAAPFAAGAQDYPKRKAGLWVLSMNMGGPKAHVVETKMCIDPGTDAAMYKMGMETVGAACSKHDMRRDGNTLILDSECKFGEQTIKSHGVIAFSGDTSYHGEIMAHMDPPIGANGDHTMIQDAKWTGPCPGDMSPGDMVMPGGMKMNIKDMGGMVRPPPGR